MTYDDAIVLAELDRADGFISDYYSELTSGWRKIIAIDAAGGTFVWFDERDRWQHQKTQVLQ
jgi:hypothetical protein